MIRVAITDDEVLARQKLRQLLRTEPDIEIVGECATALETLEVVKATHPDVLFLDIRMPGMDGFDLVGALTSSAPAQRPQIVFTTAFDQYAVKAFEIHAADYLLKPFSAERLRSTVQRVRDHATTAATLSDTSASSAAYTTRLVFKSRGRILFLSVEDIRWIAAEENYVRISTAAESHLLRETIGHMETRLDPQTFLRVHRSSIVNLRFVKEVKSENDGDATVILVSGERIPMSRSYRARVQKLLRP